VHTPQSPSGEPSAREPLREPIHLHGSALFTFGDSLGPIDFDRFKGPRDSIFPRCPRGWWVTQLAVNVGAPTLRAKPDKIGSGSLSVVGIRLAHECPR
jgi:hypothetical protein